MRALIIDDSALMRRIVGMALGEAGMPFDEIIEAGNGMEAIAALERLKISGVPLDLILCDVHMPVLDGIGFLRERAGRGLATARVLMVTADVGDPVLAEAVALGASGFISKPFSVAQIREQALTAMGRP